MANSEIRIDDDYVKTMGMRVSEWTKDLQKGIDTYIKIMDGVLADAIMEGETAIALEEFAGYARQLSQMIEPVGTEVLGLSINFLDEVDAADSDLY